MRPRIANPRSDMSQDERDAPAATDGPRGAAPRYTPRRADCVRLGAPAKKEIPFREGGCPADRQPDSLVLASAGTEAGRAAPGRWD